MSEDPVFIVRHRKSLVLTGILLGLSIAGSWAFVQKWSSIPMGESISPPGWAITFKIPAGWTAQQADSRIDDLSFASANSPERTVRMVRQTFASPVELKKQSRIYLASLLQSSNLSTKSIQKALIEEVVDLGELTGVRCRLPGINIILWAGSPDGKLGRDIYFMEYIFDFQKGVPGPGKANANECKAIAESIRVKH